MSIRVMLADDHRMFREAVRIPLAAEPDIEIVGEAGTGAEALAGVAEWTPDVVVLDVALPDISGVDVAERLQKKDACPRIVALSGYSDRFFVDEMFKHGAQAYVLKSSGADDLLRAIRAVFHGERFVSPELADDRVRNDSGDEAGSPPLPSVLGRREKQVLALLADGKRSAEIAQTLGIATGTVDVYRRSIRQKLGLGSVAELTRYAMRFGLSANS